jgi:hypothetical protein
VVPFPDSITTGGGLPPGVTDSTTRALGGDTLVQTQLHVFPAYVVGRDQVGPGAPTSAPMRVNLRVFARDTSVGVLRDRPLVLAECPIVLRLYHGADRSAPPAWRSDAAPRALACPSARQYRANDFQFEWPAPALLDDSLPAGRYAFAYTVRLADGRTLDYAAGGAYLTADPSPPTRSRAALRMAARSEVVGQAPRSLRTTVAVVNTGSHPVAFEHGACNVNVRLYRDPAHRSRPGWRSEARSPAGEHGGYACIAILYTPVVAPGDSLLFAPVIPLWEVLADSLPAGRYYVGAELTLLNDDRPADRWETVYRLDAGAVELTRAPDPLPSSRTLDGLTYVATTRLVRGTEPDADTVRTLVLVTNQGSTRVEAEVPRDCPVAVYAYRSAALRDSVPVQEPAWRSSGPCYLIPHRFALAPGESWVFQHEVPTAAMIARAGVGRYWFTAWIAGTPSVMLAAGDVELAR